MSDGAITKTEKEVQVVFWCPKNLDIFITKIDKLEINKSGSNFEGENVSKPVSLKLLILGIQLWVHLDQKVQLDQVSPPLKGPKFRSWHGPGNAYSLII